MPVVRLSWVHRVRKWLFKKRSARETIEESSGSVPMTTSETGKYLSKEKRLAQTTNSSASPAAAVPTSMKYITASGKQVLTVLESAANVIPVPMLQQAIGVALKIIQLCEEASAVEQKVKELQVRVGHLMIIILAHITDKNEDGDQEVVVTAAKGIEEDIKELLNTLRTINKDLAEIKAQNRWVLTIYKDLNMSTIDDCMNRLSASLEKFKIANDLRDSDLLQNLFSRLQTMAKQVDVISKDMKHVVGAVDNIQLNLDTTRQAFDEVLSRVKQSATLSSSEGVRQQMPLKPEVFCGRDNLVKDISQLLLKEETSRVCILGPGGMGKTSVALAVVESPLIQERFSQEKCVWVPCIGATSAGLLLEIISIQLQVPGDKLVTLEKIVAELSSSDAPSLLLLDNFETPWNAPGGTQKEVEDILRRLAQLNHVAIVVTMRGKYPPCDNAIKWQSRNVRPTDEEACLRMFHEINPDSRGDPKVSSLLRALGYMPFAITLMARLAKEGGSTAEELLRAWSDSGPDIISDNPEKSMNRSISLSVESPLVQQNPNAVQLLAVLSLLPAGTTKGNLSWWAPTLKSSMIPSAIATLSKAALLLETKLEDSDSTVFFVVPVVQSFMQQHDRIPSRIRNQIQSVCCKYAVEHACRFDEPSFLVKSKALAVEDSNIQSILFGPATAQERNMSANTMEALIAFCWYRCDTKPNPDLAKHAVAVARSSGIEKYMAVAEWCLGRTYYHVDANSLSLEHLQQAYKLFNTPGDLEWQRLGGKCGIDLVDTARHVFDDNMDVVRLAHDVEAKCAGLSDDLIHGRSLLFLGVALGEAEQSQEALSYLNRARVMLKAVGNIPSIAVVYQAIGRVLLMEERISEAVDAMEEAWKQAATIDVAYIQADISLEYAISLFKADRNADALKYLELALTKFSFIGNGLGVAYALDYMGYGYLRLGDLEDAFRAYETAAGAYLQVDSTWASERCQSNMVQIEHKRRTPDETFGFYRPAPERDESFFHPSYQPPVAGDLPVPES